MQVEISTDLATYTVTERVTREGRLEVSFATSNPPRGLDGEIWRWEGRLSALSGPFTEREALLLTVVEGLSKPTVVEEGGGSDGEG